MSPSLREQNDVVLKWTFKSDIELTALSCVVLGKLLNLIKFQYSPLKNRDNNSLMFVIIMFNVTVKIQ